MTHEHKHTPTRWDTLGIVLSGLCLVHCMLMPFALTALPLIGLSFSEHEGFHQVMAGILVAVSLFAFVPGWRKHRRAAVFYWSVPGLALILTGAFVAHELWGHDAETALTIAGGACLIFAHYFNRRYLKHCTAQHAGHAH